MWVNTEIIRYFQKWGDFEEKVERQRKGAQNVCNEPIEPPLGPWVHSSACYEEKSLFKTQNFQKRHIFYCISTRGIPSGKMTSNKVIFGNFEF